MNASTQKIVGVTGAIVAVIAVGLLVWRLMGGTTLPLTIPLLMMVMAAGLLIAGGSKQS